METVLPTQFFRVVSCMSLPFIYHVVYPFHILMLLLGLYQESAGREHADPQAHNKRKRTG